MIKKIFILGPTASGKTELAKYVYDHFEVELISVDSAQIYRGMNIGTAKLSDKELLKYPHHLVNIKDPLEHYSVSEFRQNVEKVSIEAQANAKNLVLVGGTMMYFNALEYSLDDIPTSTPEIREKVDQELTQYGLDVLYKKLKTIDPVAATRINPSDKQRIQRAIEVFYLSGKPLSSFQKNKEKIKLSHEILKIALVPSDRSLLHDQIQKRTQDMLSNGLLSEVEDLMALHQELSDHYPSFRSVGYRQAYRFLLGEIQKEDLAYKITVATRQLAKRQLTWIRGMHNLVVFDPFAKNLQSNVNKEIKQFLKI